VTGGEFTVGAEEELLLVDEAGRLLGGDAASVRASLCGGCTLPGAVSEEIFQDQVELNTPACSDGEDLAARLGDLRSWLIQRGVRPMAVGVHPDAEFGSISPTSSVRYDGILAELAGLFRTPTAALQVHVALPDSDTALVAYRGLRNRLCVLRALSAASPFWHGRDSGLASARSAIIRSYPRVGVPPVLRRWDEYVAATARITMAAQVPDYTFVWWDLRPQPRLGTLEVRLMDVQASLSRVAGLTALVQGMTRHLVDNPDAVDLPDDVLAANDFRACRHGLDTTVVDIDGCSRPLREVAQRILRQARQALAADGLDRALDVVEAMVRAPAEADRQRRLHQEHGMTALLEDLVARTSGLDG
jgi:glutamate---cysteine ligase / carboxylate-amine ligase